MKTKPSFYKIWLLNALGCLLFFGIFLIIKFPKEYILFGVFVAVAFPLFTFTSAAFTTFCLSIQIDESGISSINILGESVSWEKIKSIRTQWPGIYISSGFGKPYTLIPMRWLIKNKDEFDTTLEQLALKYEWAQKLRDKACPKLPEKEHTE